MTEAELQAIRERAQKATPGPWLFERGSNHGDGDPVSLTNNDGELIIWPTIRCGLNSSVYLRLEWAYATRDADFIAHARTDIPDLLAEVERLQAELKAGHA